jgi:hypothetical protein
VQGTDDFERTERRGEAIAGVDAVDRSVVLNHGDVVTEEGVRRPQHPGGEILQAGEGMAGRLFQRSAERLGMAGEPTGHGRLRIADRSRRAAPR